jgi:endonuclease/exonuclease/phosphatase family metal-dependent hydrolase
VAHWDDGAVRMSEDGTRETLTLGTFNTHLGVDGWGRPYDLVQECRSLDADVLVLQESWAPDDGGPSSAETVADQLGYTLLHEANMAHCRLFDPAPNASDRWGPRIGAQTKSLLLDERSKAWFGGTTTRKFTRGHIGVALLSRVPTNGYKVIPLKVLRRDGAMRMVITCTVELAGGELQIFGTHMSHITHGSHAQYRLLSKLLPPPSVPAVLAGDMNLWGPPVVSYLRGWRRAVRARTWPAYRPHSQLDHVLVTEGVTVLGSRVGPFAGSDHLPVVVTLGLRG